MPNIETPEEFALWMHHLVELDDKGEIDYKATIAKKSAMVTARDEQYLALLKQCREKIEQALSEVKAMETYDATCTLTEALAALKEAGVM